MVYLLVKLSRDCDSKTSVEIDQDSLKDAVTQDDDKDLKTSLENTLKSKNPI